MNRLYVAKIQQRKAEAALLAANAQVEAAEAALVEIEETKADVNVPREEEESESVFPIELAAQHGHLEIVRTLTIAGANMPEYVFEDGHCDPSVTLMRCAGRARYLLQCLLLCAPLTLPLAPRPASDAVLALRLVLAKHGDDAEARSQGKALLAATPVSEFEAALHEFRGKRGTPLTRKLLAKEMMKQVRMATIGGQPTAYPRQEGKSAARMAAMGQTSHQQQQVESAVAAGEEAAEEEEGEEEEGEEEEGEEEEGEGEEEEGEEEEGEEEEGEEEVEEGEEEEGEEEEGEEEEEVKPK